MTVLIDLLRWGEGGTQTYARRVIPRLLDGIPGSLVLVEAHAAEELRNHGADGTRIILAPDSVANPYRRHLYQRSKLPEVLRERRVDVYFVPGESSGIRRSSVPRVRIVKMIRNMLPLDHDERVRFSLFGDFRVRFRLEILARSVLASLADADRVISTSEHALTVVASRQKLKDHRVVYHPVPAPVPGSIEAHDRSERTILYVSPTDPYKRQLEVIEEFERYRKTVSAGPVKLVLAGPVRGTYGRKVIQAAAKAGQGVQVLAELPQSSALQWMRRADVLLFASTCECCPNVLLEYLAAGRPIVCSDDAPMPEMAGDAAAYFSVRQPGSMVEALSAVLSDPAFSRTLVDTAAAQARRFALDATVSGTVSALTIW